MNVPAHESKVTNAQSGVEPHAYFRRCFGRSDRSRIGQQVEGHAGFKSSRPDSHPAYFAHFGECWRDSELPAVRRQRCRVSGPEPGCPVTDQNLITALPTISPVLRRSIYSLI